MPGDAGHGKEGGLEVAALVVRELEKGAAAAAMRSAAMAAGLEVERYMRRALTCFEHRAVLFVDLQSAVGDGPSHLPWRALHANAAVADVRHLPLNRCSPPHFP